MQGVDEVIYSKRKRITLAVLPGGWVQVRAPLGTSNAAIEAFVTAHRSWLEKARQKMAKVQAPVAPYAYLEGELIRYLGENLPLRLLPGARKAYLNEAREIVLPKGTKKAIRAALEAFYRAETRRIVSGFVALHAPRLAVNPQVMRINSAKRRWGSCSARGSLNFSLRLAMVPLDCIEYVAVHELAHLRQHNHSAAFWALVKGILPDYARRREWLKRNGSLLPPL